MAAYKVPQDVEAEDKLIGPFGFRQFIYLGIAGASAFMAYVLAGVSPFLIVIPLPIIGFFTILALPLRKEQPMETYVLALVRFFLKPKQRLWNPDGTISYVEIIAPKTTEQHLAKEYNADTASQRIDYLARVMDSRGWALKGATQPTANLSHDVVAEIQSAVDVFDEGASLSQSFANMIAQQDKQRRQNAMAQMQRASAPVSQPQAQTAMPAAPPVDDTTPAPQFNPYPSSMHQRVIQPIGAQAQAPAPAPRPAVAAPARPQPQPQPAVPRPVSPDIIRLANNDDLSISAIAHEAHRLTNEDEVVIKLH